MALSAEYAALQAQSTEFGKKIEDLRLEEEKMYIVSADYMDKIIY